MSNKRKSDTVIFVMGLTGAGKSTFINTAVGKPVTRVGHGLASCTKDVSSVPVPYPRDKSRTVLFVETPGLDNMYFDDSEVIKRIAEWLTGSLKPRMKIAGIIYVIDISEHVITQTQKNMLRAFCQQGVAENITLAIMKWSSFKEDVGRQREKDLSESYWKELLDQGSRMVRFAGTWESAWDIIDLIIDQKPIDAVLFQSLVGIGNPKQAKPSRNNNFIKKFFGIY